MSRRIGTAALLLGSLFIHTASAQERYQSLVVFGDSYADNGNRIARFGDPASPLPRHIDLGSLGFYSYTTALQHDLGIADPGMLNYAFAGAESGPGTPPGLLGFNEQIQAALGQGQSFNANSLVVINIGGNDSSASTGGLTSLALAPSVAATAAANIGTGVQSLFNAGARNFLISTFDDPSLIPNVHTGSFGQAAIDADKLYGALLYSQEQAALKSVADQGARIFTFNLSQFARELYANPAAYGFVNVFTPCQSVGTICATPSSPGQFTYATYDGLHLTTGAFQFVARYMERLIEGPQSFPGQADFAQSLIGNTANSVFNRIDAVRDEALGQLWTVYIQGTGQTGDFDGNPDARGYHYDAGGGQLGIEYRASKTISAGAVFSYTSPTVSLGQDAGHYDADAYQFAAYASYFAASLFVDGLLSYGRTDYDLDRPGVVDTIKGKTGANSYAAAARAGYLFDAGVVRLGPIGELRYSRSSVEAYTETGDPLLTFHVDKQSMEQLDGAAGIQLRAPVSHGLSPYLNLMAAHAFMGGTRTLTVFETQSPTLPIATRIDDKGPELYGKAELGASAQLTDQLHLFVDVASAFGGGKGYDLAGSVGLGYQF